MPEDRAPELREKCVHPPHSTTPPAPAREIRLRVVNAAGKPDPAAKTVEVHAGRTAKVEPTNRAKTVEARTRSKAPPRMASIHHPADLPSDQ
jgi:hypothetical protein